MQADRGGDEWPPPIVDPIHQLITRQGQEKASRPPTMDAQQFFLNLKPDSDGRTDELSCSDRQVANYGDHQGASELILASADGISAN